MIKPVQPAYRVYFTFFIDVFPYTFFDQEILMIEFISLYDEINAY